MVEDTIDYSSQSPVNIDTLVIPTGNQLWNGPLEHLDRNLPSWLVQDITSTSQSHINALLFDLHHEPEVIFG